MRDVVESRVGGPESFPSCLELCQVPWEVLERICSLWGLLSILLLSTMGGALSGGPMKGFICKPICAAVKWFLHHGDISLTVVSKMDFCKANSFKNAWREVSISRNFIRHGHNLLCFISFYLLWFFKSSFNQYVGKLKYCFSFIPLHHPSLSSCWMSPEIQDLGCAQASIRDGLCPQEVGKMRQTVYK